MSLRDLPETPDTEEDIVQIMDEFVEHHLQNVHTILPGRILSYEGHATRKATVEVSVNVPTATNEFLAVQPITNVPVVFPSSAASSMLIPIAKGDGVLLCFSEAAIGNFLNGDVTVDPEDFARFSTTDCIAIPGFFSNPKVPTLSETANATDTYLMHNDSIIQLSDDNVTIKKGTTTIVVDSSGDVTVTSDGATTINAAGKAVVSGSAIELNGNTKPFVTHAELDTALQLMVTLINTHTHLYAPGPLPPIVTAPPLPLAVLNIAAAATTTVSTGG